MDEFKRFAIYFCPESGALADFGARWLGWDLAQGAAVPHLTVPDLPANIEAITAAPRRYGFHATLKPPFRLKPETTPQKLHRAVARLATDIQPVMLDGLVLSRLGNFLALTPIGDQGALADCAARIVTGLDEFRAPPTANETARRNPEALSARQRQLLALWGYPYLMEEFRFHMTLTGPQEQPALEILQSILSRLLQGNLPEPFTVGSVCLCAETRHGNFKLLHRYPLGP